MFPHTNLIAFCLTNSVVEFAHHFLRQFKGKMVHVMILPYKNWPAVYFNKSATTDGKVYKSLQAFIQT